jgi:predicted enzyme related to lactoylglutathione lyase
MINLRVENLLELLETLRAEGVRVFDETEDGDFGKFGWILDPEGNKIELWEPI